MDYQQLWQAKSRVQEGLVREVAGLLERREDLRGRLERRSRSRCRRKTDEIPREWRCTDCPNAYSRLNSLQSHCLLKHNKQCAQSRGLKSTTKH